MSESYPFGKFPDDNPLFSIDFDAEKTPFERLASSLLNRVMDLEVHNVAPTVLTKEVIDVPFGAYSEYKLCATLHRHEDGGLEGSLAINNPVGKPLLPRTVRAESATEPASWTLSGSEQVLTDKNILNKLDRNWPTHLFDNSEIREAASEDQDTVQSPEEQRQKIFDIVTETLRPHASRQDTVKKYVYNDLPSADEFASPDDARPSETVVEAWWATQEDSSESTLSIKLIHSSLEDIDGYTAQVEKAVTVDEEGGINVEQHYKDLKTKQWIDLPIEDEESFVNDILFYLNTLVTEKTAQSKN